MMAPINTSKVPIPQATMILAIFHLGGGGGGGGGGARRGGEGMEVNTISK